MTFLRTLLLSLALVFSASSAAWPQDFSKGLEAARAGDYATALQEWRPLAEQGDASAQHNLGVMYDNGRGVPQDFVLANMWANIASANGGLKAGELREFIADKMSSADISTTQSMAGRCMASDYADFGG